MSAPAASPAPVRRQSLVVAGLGVCQIVAFGTSLYLLTVLAAPIAAETGWPLPFVVSGFTCGVLTAACVAPLAGRLVGAGHGRSVLAASSVLFALGLCALALASNRPVYVGAWLLIGCGMGFGLYDVCFAALARAYGPGARAAIARVAMIGGLASAVFWPTSSALVAAVGWRGTAAVFAGLHLVLCLPLYRTLLPRAARADETASGAGPPARLAGPERVAYALYAGLVILESGLAALVSVHLLVILDSRGVDSAAAVALAALIGPAQILARVAEASLGARGHPGVSAVLSSVAITAGLSAIALDAGVLGLAVVAYGAGIGLASVVRGTLPLVLFGSERAPALMGRVARPALVLQALCPLAGAMAITRFGVDATLWTLVAAAFVTAAVSLPLAAAAARRMRAQAQEEAQADAS